MAAGKIAVIGVVTIAIMLIILYITLTYYSSGQAITNLKASQIYSYTDANYSVLNSAVYKNLTGNLKAEGYRELSVLVYSYPLFNFSSNTIPSTITSEIYLMSNSSSALSAEKSLIPSANPIQNITVYTYNAVSTYGSVSPIKIYNVYSVSAYNYSTAASTIIPVYQDSAIFSYKNVVISVVSNGGPMMLRNISLKLAEDLAAMYS